LYTLFKGLLQLEKINIIIKYIGSFFIVNLMKYKKK